MNTHHKLIAATAIATVLTAPAAVQALSIDSTLAGDAAGLAALLAGPGSGITIIGGTESYIGATSASGTFSGGAASGIGIDSGVILSSGAAADAVGPNDADGLTTAHGLPGDTDLDTATPDPTFDAAALIFDFTTDTGDLFFDYVFASEEYNEFIESGVTDAFAFFVDGTNIALVPGTTDPVNINTVNCGNPFAPPSGGSNCSLFNNNDLDDGGPFFDIQYDGFTDVFTAAIVGLGAGTHTMKLVVGDAGDDVLDSAVFLEAGSFSSTDPGGSVPEPGTLALAGFGLAALGRVRRRRKA